MSVYKKKGARGGGDVETNAGHVCACDEREDVKVSERQ